MNARIPLAAAGLLLVVCGGALSQSQPAPPPPPDDRFMRVGPVPGAPSEKSVDDLLTELEHLRAHKAALEKKEQELTALLRKKLDAQAERIKKLGVAPKDAKPAEPDRVGRILIMGNVTTPDRKILDKLELRPGQILHYPKLEAARAALEKAGFRDVTVEVLPNEFDSTIKDVRVQITEPKR